MILPFSKIIYHRISNIYICYFYVKKNYFIKECKKYLSAKVKKRIIFYWGNFLEVHFFWDLVSDKKSCFVIKNSIFFFILFIVLILWIKKIQGLIDHFFFRPANAQIKKVKNILTQKLELFLLQKINAEITISPKKKSLQIACSLFNGYKRK
jgi:hypothetical protein